MIENGSPVWCLLWGEGKIEWVKDDEITVRFTTITAEGEERGFCRRYTRFGVPTTISFANTRTLFFSKPVVIGKIDFPRLYNGNKDDVVHVQRIGEVEGTTGLYLNEDENAFNIRVWNRHQNAFYHKSFEKYTQGDTPVRKIMVGEASLTTLMKQGDLFTIDGVIHEYVSEDATTITSKRGGFHNVIIKPFNNDYTFTVIGENIILQPGELVHLTMRDDHVVVGTVAKESVEYLVYLEDPSTKGKFIKIPRIDIKSIKRLVVQ